MAFLPFTVSALKVEFLADPLSMGYSPFMSAMDENSLVDLVNGKRGGGAFQVMRDPVQPEALFAQVDPTDFAALNSLGLAQLLTVMSLQVLDLNASNILAILNGIFPTGVTTRANFATFSTREGSRAEVLWGPGVYVTVNQVNQALH